MLTTLPFSGFYNSKWSDELDNVENNFIENEAENDDTLDESEISAIVDKCRQYETQMQYPEGPLDLVQFVGDFFQMPRSSK